MLKYLRLEIRKNHMGMLLFLTAVFIGLNFAWQYMNLHNPDEQTRYWGWMMMLSQTPIVNAILAPTFMAVIASRIADVEHKGSTLKLLFTLQPRLSLYHAKVLVGVIFSVLVSIGQALVVIVSGILVRFEGSVPMDKIVVYFSISCLVTFASYLLQLNLSLSIQNQMAPLAIGILGSFCGLFVMYLYQFKFLQHIVLWTNYVTTAVSTLSFYDAKTREIAYEWCPVNWYGIGAVMIWMVLLYVWGRRIAVRKEV